LDQTAWDRSSRPATDLPQPNTTDFCLLLLRWGSLHSAECTTLPDATVIPTLCTLEGHLRSRTPHSLARHQAISVARATPTGREVTRWSTKGTELWTPQTTQRTVCREATLGCGVAGGPPALRHRIPSGDRRHGSGRCLPVGNGSRGDFRSPSAAIKQGPPQSSSASGSTDLASMPAATTHGAKRSLLHAAA
jgi:hypothetical protein